MNCHRLSNLLSAYIDGELTGVEMLEIRGHVDGCPACREELEQVRAVKRMVGRLRTAQPSGDFGTRICASLDGVKPCSFLGTWVEAWQGAFRKLSPAAIAISGVALGLLVYTAGTLDEQLSSHPTAPIVASSVGPTMPVGMSMEQPDSSNLRVVFANRRVGAQPNAWIIPASDYVTR